MNKKFSIDVIYQAGAGGEFLSCLLFSHRSNLWTSVPLCCYLNTYSPIRIALEEKYNFPFYTRHEVTDRPLAPKTIKLTTDLNYLKILKETKGPFVHKQMSGYPINKEIDNFKADVEVDFFNPHLSYEELCTLLELEPDYKWFCTAYKNYYLWQRQFVKRFTKLTKAINTMTKEINNGD